MTGALRRGLAGPVAALVGGISGIAAAVDFRIAFGAVGAAGVALLVYIGPGVLLLGVLASEPWADTLRYPTATLTIPKIIGFLAVTSFVFAAATGRVMFRSAPPIRWALGFLLMIVVSLMLSPDPSTGLGKTISYALYVTFLAVFVQMIRDRKGVERALAVYAISATFAAGDGLIHFLGGQHLASGPITDPNAFAYILAGALPVSVYFAFSAKHRRPWLISIALIAGTLLATYSRGAIVGFAAVLVWAVLTRRISLPGILAGVATVAVVAGIAVIYLQPLIQERLVQKSQIANANVSSRLAFWSAAWRMSLDHPVLGVGPGRFGAESQFYLLNDPIQLVNPVVHNSYLEILAEDGPAALALYLAFLISSWRCLQFVRRRAIEASDRRGRRLADALMASFLWTCAAGGFVSMQLSVPLWLIAGLAASLALSLRAPPEVVERSETGTPPLNPSRLQSAAWVPTHS